MYDGFYAVVANLEGDINEIIRINQQRWEIEENFRIMKDELGSRPAFVRRGDIIIGLNPVLPLSEQLANKPEKSKSSITFFRV